MLYMYIKIYHIINFCENIYFNGMREPDPIGLYYLSVAFWLWIPLMLYICCTCCTCLSSRSQASDSVTDFLVRKLSHGWKCWMTVEIFSGSTLTWVLWTSRVKTRTCGNLWEVLRCVVLQLHLPFFQIVPQVVWIFFGAWGQQPEYTLMSHKCSTALKMKNHMDQGDCWCRESKTPSYVLALR